MFCPKCGTKQDGDGRFCPGCGADLSEYLGYVETKSEPNVTDEPTVIEEPIIVEETNAVEEATTVDESTTVIETETEDTAHEAIKPAAYASAAIPPNANDNYVKPKRKGAGKGIAALILIALVAASAVFGIKNFAGSFGGGGGGGKYVLLRDGYYYLSSNPEKDKDIEIAAARAEYVSENLVNFSPDGKYVYFFTKVEEGLGTLCRAEISKLKRDSTKNEKYIENIASNVNLYPGVSFLSSDKAVYKNGSNNLYMFDGSDSQLIDKDVTEYYSDDSGKLIYLVDQSSDDENGEYKYSAALYGIDINNPENKIKMATGVSYLYSNDDFNNIIFIKSDEEGNQALYMAGFDKEETTKISNSATTYGISGNTMFYTRENGKRLLLYDYVNDGGEDPNYVKTDLQDEENAVPVHNLYTFKNGEEVLIAEDVIYAYQYNGMLAYNTVDMISKKLPLDSVGSIYDVERLFDINYAEANYIKFDNPDVTMKMSQKVADDLIGPDGESYPYFYVKGDYVYITNNGDIYVATIEDNQFTAIAPLGFSEESYVIADDETKLYIQSGSHYYDEWTYCDVYELSGGVATKLAQDVVLDRLTLYDDGTLFGFTDYRYYSDIGSGDLAMFNSDGEKTSIGEDVSQFIRKSKNETVYISDDNLYIFDGKEKTKLKSDVKQVWCSDFVEKSKVMTHRYGY